MEPTFIIFSGLAGTGKTTLSRLVARRLQIPIVSFDHFVDDSWPRRLLDVEVLTDDELWHILISTVELQLSVGVSVIMDAIFWGAGREQAKQIAKKHGARFRAIHTYCSDETIWRSRVLERYASASPEETPAKWEDIVTSQQNFRPWKPEEALFVDAVDDMHENLEKAVAYLL